MLDRHFVFLNIVAHINIQEFTTTQVLTMQFCKGFKVDDVESLKRTNVSPEKVGNHSLCISYEIHLWSVTSI
jgi:predicted unusual protein kinase regulating ubiquinone biosynthesis (AarF/ABC1/UbiB family)